MAYEVDKSEDEWRAQLGLDEFEVLRHAATEPPFSGKYVHNHDDGTYRCGACGAVLF
ncbi:MAG: peptide-methionine (R)-S-oxide reductase, partial [Acidimicrobiaceae bacterium]|nr:peptide-methionine (R)-S-oxide reductase [Acidimicrobiaceae bacterium]